MKTPWILRIASALIITLLLCGCAPSFPTEETERIAFEPDILDTRRDYPLDLLCGEADVILLGTVTGCDEGHDMTDEEKARGNILSVKVEQSLFGEIQARSTILVEDTGYNFERDGETKEMTQFGEALLQKGYRVVLFLEEEPDGEPYELAEHVLGKWIVDETDSAYPAMSFSTLYREGRTLAPIMETMEPIPLDTLLSQIDSAVQ